MQNSRVKDFMVLQHPAHMILFRARILGLVMNILIALPLQMCGELWTSVKSNLR